MRFRDRIAQFMAGRNGYDAFNQFLLLAAVLLMLLSTLFSRTPVIGALLSVLEWAALIYCLYRTFSKNLYQRQRENAAYYAKRQEFVRWVQSLRDRWRQRKEFKFFRCPSCHALLRVPRGKGKLILTCRKCGNRFERKS